MLDVILFVCLHLSQPRAQEAVRAWSAESYPLDRGPAVPVPKEPVIDNRPKRRRGGFQ